MFRTRKYRALLLDFYGTLVEEDTAVIRGIARVIAARSPCGSSPEDIAKTWSRKFSELCLAAYRDSFECQRTIEHASLVALLGEYQVNLDAEELSKELFDYWRAPEPYPSSGRFLSGLHAPTCIVSNIDDGDLTAAIRRQGWHFDHIVTSQQCRAYKPRSEPFLKAVELLKLSPAEVVHVGDSIGSDVIGAQSIGIDTVWVNRSGRALPMGAKPPSHVVSDVDELLGFVE